MRRLTGLLVLCLAALPAIAAEQFTFPSIDGGTLAFEDWRGRPLLVANTASLCGFTPQYDDLQALYERYRAKGLVVLAVPSDDFRQELATEEEVKDFCAVNFDLDLPMTEITHVRGPRAHPFYRWLAKEHGFAPQWNFYKVLIGPDGAFLGAWPSATAPLSREITGAIEALLPE